MPNVIEDADITYLVDSIISRALKNGASDIHFDPSREGCKIRLRVDGTLRRAEEVNEVKQQLIVSRIKVIANLDLSEHSLPQDGHFEFTQGMRTYSLRVSIFPTIYGEAVVMRIFNRETLLINIEKLGFEEDQLFTLKSLISQPHGIILVTGPSGSGKTTLLYSLLNQLNTSENNILTIEEPVELQLQNIRQSQIKKARGFNFSTALRSVLRQDADILMIGEIRDRESAEISYQAALTGRLVLTTLHTLDVFAVVARLIEMEIPRSIIAHATLGVVSSRLIRQICLGCKTEYQPNKEEMEAYPGFLQQSPPLFTGRGCETCMETGFLGQTGIYEIFLFDDEIRAGIIEESHISGLLPILKSKKVKSLQQSALDKVRRGITTLSEVTRVTGARR